jgi:hypothetical protein
MMNELKVNYEPWMNIHMNELLHYVKMVYVSTSWCYCKDFDVVPMKRHKIYYREGSDAFFQRLRAV